tara:strand:+ start:118 stop:228 length:111 start_codon:yes stop_codon:yes gene_type:complete
MPIHLARGSMALYHFGEDLHREDGKGEGFGISGAGG